MRPVSDAAPQLCPADALLDGGAQAHQVHGDGLAVAAVGAGGVLSGVGVDGALRRVEPAAGQDAAPRLERAVQRPASRSGQHVRVDRTWLLRYHGAAAKAPDLAHQVTVTGLRRREPGRTGGAAGPAGVSGVACRSSVRARAADAVMRAVTAGGSSAMGTCPQRGRAANRVPGGSSPSWRDPRSSRWSREPNATVTGAPMGGPER